MEEENKRKIIKLALIKLGVKCDLSGFNFLLEAIMLAIDDPLIVYNQKKLYDKVTSICNVDSTNKVESNMQNAINCTYNTKGFLAMNDLYGMEVFQETYKPTVAEIIKLLAEYYNLELYKKSVLST